jgi:hypothetical protein
MSDNSFDPNQYRKQTINRLIIGGILLLFVVGVGLILYYYGPGAAGMGTLCLIGGLLPLAIIITILALMQWIVDRNRPK